MLRSSIFRTDLKYSIISGLMAGFIVWRISLFLDLPRFFGIPYYLAIPVIPIIWFLGVNFGYFLGRWITAFNRFGKFVAVGFTNAAVDFGILNSLIALSGVDQGGFYSLFKTISFLVAFINSYIFNKFWTFEAGKSGGGIKEVLGFSGVAVLTVFVNVVVASVVVNFIDPIGGLDSKIWANIGAMAGAAAGLIFSFIGFGRVFKK